MKLYLQRTFEVRRSYNQEYSNQTIKMTVDKVKHNKRCYMDISIDGENVGRITMELFNQVCPITCENFRALCTGELGFGKTTNKPLHYKDAPFHRVVKNFVIQGGDFVAGNGTGGESIYGGQFKDENFDIPHDKPFLLSMSNRGKDTNGSQFFITTQPAPHLNGKHTVFGQVLLGQEVVTKIENIKTDSNCRPTKDVCISACGELVREKVIQKERKRRASVESSDSESEEERVKRKKKHKKEKKHKKDKKEAKESISSSRREEDSGGCMVDPEEIPSVPTNNFLMRRTSPVGDRNRRPPPRESYNYDRRPVISRSGRKIKGRGFMRYRTPSRSASRSGSETPPHWKQAQSRLKNIKDVVLPKKEIPPEDSWSQNEDMEDPVPRGNVLHSRLGAVAKSNEDQKLQKDARSIMRENRRNRDWSPDESPPPRGTIGSTVVVTSNFQKDQEQTDRFRHNDWQGGRRGRSPNRRGSDRFNDQDRSNRFNDNNRNWGADRFNNDHNRRPAAENRKEPERKQRSDKDIHKRLRSLAGELSRYRKHSESSSDSEESDKDSKKGRDAKGKSAKENVDQKPKDRLKSLANELKGLSKMQDSSSSSESEEDRPKKATTPPVPPPKVAVLREVQRIKTPTKNLKSLANELSAYHKQQSDSSSDSSSEEEIQIKKETDPKSKVTKDKEVLSETRLFDNSQVKIPGICDSYEDEPEMSSVPSLATLPLPEEPVAKDEAFKVFSKTGEEDQEKVPTPVKEKRRWDMQESDAKKKAGESIQIVFHTTTLSNTMPDVIPLPDETRPSKVLPPDYAQIPVPEVIHSVAKGQTPDSDRSRSGSPVSKIPRIQSSSPKSESKPLRDQDKLEDSDHKPSLSSLQKKPEPRDHSRSPSPKTSSSKQRSTSRSKSPVRRRSSKSPIRRRTSKSPIRRRTSKSPIRRRTSKSPIRRRTSKSPIRRRTSKSPIRRKLSKSPRRGRQSKSRSRSRDRIRRRRTRSPIRPIRRSLSRDRGSRFRGRLGNRSPDRRPLFPRRYGNSRRGGRSRSPVRRRHNRRSSSSSGSSSSRSSSSRSDRKKRVGKGRRSSSSSSSRSKKSDSDSGSP
ncbi:hypothetical protein JTE90_007054 [Oedothorax gibbosus]|uniref:peptidylprolyl isomerase n=1 Tax=Oedothorax gibbosus TaxID=931172 RepID=A0AAV6U2A9_9ARAC|nr:hypothetical protein JTE90_007054 [Oedothorax gibbosus]